MLKYVIIQDSYISNSKGEENMKNFDEIYLNIKNGNLDIIIQNLQTKVEERSATKEEVKKLENYTNIKNNTSKIDNILEFKTKLEQEKNEIEKEIAKRKNEIKLDDKINELNIQLQNLLVEKQALQQSLSNPNLKDEEKQKIESRIAKIDLDISSNQSEFSKAQQALTNSEKIENRFKEDISDLENKKMEICSKISKCNMIVNNLIQGKNWNYIEMKLDNWKDRKFTSKEPLSEKAEPIKEEVQPIKEEVEEKTKNTSDNKEEKNGEENKKIEDEEPIFKDHDIEEMQLDKTFDDKYPRLAKIRNFLKNATKRVKDYITSLINKKESKENIELEVENIEKDENSEEIANTENTEKVVEEVENVKEEVKEEKANENDFKEYIKKIAEKGMEEIKKEKLENAKREAYKRETEKFGKEYADKSYNEENEER